MQHNFAHVMYPNYVSDLITLTAHLLMSARRVSDCFGCMRVNASQIHEICRKMKQSC